MRCGFSLQWSIWISIVAIGLLQIFVIYSSLIRYITLRIETFKGYHVAYDEYKWIMYLLNFQLFVIIGALGALPLWIYSLLFSLSSFLCNNYSPQLTRQGFYELLWKEAVNVLNPNQVGKTKLKPTPQSRNCCSKKQIKIGVFYPIASMFYVFIAYSLLLPVPFIDAWLIQIDHDNKEGLSNNDIDFVLSRSLIVKIKWSLEYFNFLLSLIVFSLQYPSLIWTTNKLFSITFSLLEFLIVLHILIDFPLISIAVKYYFQHHRHYTLLYTTILVASSVIGNILLLFTVFSVFQFVYEKCVQTLLRSSWFSNNYRVDFTSSTINIDQYPSQSSASISVLCASDKIREVKTSFYPFVCAALFFICVITVKGGIYIQYREFRMESKLFIIYLIQSLILVVVYFMFWFGIALKPKWNFSLKEIEKKLSSHTTSSQKDEANYYKVLKNNLKTSQTSLSYASNTNLSLRSNPNQQTNSRMDFTSMDSYLNKCTSLKMPIQTQDIQDYNDYSKLNQHLNQARIYKTMYASVTSPKIFIDDRKDISKLQANSYYKCGNSFSNLKSNDNPRYEDPSQLVKNPGIEFSIQEETSNDNISAISDDVSSNMTSSPNADFGNKNNSNMKFVTFRLENNAEIETEISSNTSNESLTVISLAQSEAFLKELDGDGSDKISFAALKNDINPEFRNKFILPLRSNTTDSLSFPINHPSNASLL